MARRIRRLHVVALVVLSAAAGPRQALSLEDPGAIRQLLDRGRFPAAESAATALIERLDSRPLDHPGLQAEALELLVESLVEGGKFLEARAPEAAERSLAIRRAHPGPDSLDLADALMAFGRLMAARRQDSLAAVTFARVVRIREHALGSEHPAFATALHELGWRSMWLSRPREADSLFKRAATIRERALGTEHRDYTESAAALAYSDEVLGGRDTVLYAQAVMGTRRVLGPRHPLLARQLIWYAGWLRNLGRYDHAHALMEQAVEIYERALGSRNVLTARALRLTGVNLLWSARTKQALPYYERAVEITAALVPPEHLENAHPLMDLGDAHFRLGNEAAARPYFERAVDIWERELPPNSSLLALGLDHLGELLLAMGERQKARSLIARGLEIRRKCSSSGSLDIGVSLDHLGQASGDDPPRAWALYREAAGIYCEVFGPESSVSGRGWALRGGVAAFEGNVEQAIRHYQRSAAIYGRTRPHGQDLAWIEKGLAIALQRAGRSQEATLHFQRSLSSFERSAGPSNTLTGMALRDLGVHLASYGERDSAFRALLKAEEIRRAHMEQNIRVLPEQQALRWALGFVSLRAASLDVLVSLAVTAPSAGRLALAWDAVIRSRALVLDEMGERQRTLHAHAGPEVLALSVQYDSLSRRLSNLESLASVLGPSQHRAQRERAVEEQSRVARALADNSASFRAERQRAHLGLADVADKLPTRSALVAFVRYTRFQPSGSGGTLRGDSLLAYAAFILRSRAEGPIVVRLPKASEVDRQVVLWKDHMARGVSAKRPRVAAPEAAYRRDAAHLRRLVWDPLAAHLQGIETVFVVPDGPLSLVNFATLPVAGSEYLIERGPLFHYLATERDLAAAARDSSLGSGLLAVGAPAFDADPAALTRRDDQEQGSRSDYRGPRSACADFRSLRFGSLPHSELEIEDVANLWREFGASGRPTSQKPLQRAPELLSGAHASEAKFKAKAPGRRAIHLATHGFFLGEDCSAPDTAQRGIGGITLARKPERQQSPPNDNPLLLSGLALSGANLRDRASADQDDGILTAEEIGVLDLSSVEWAVLSACDTGVGRIHAGEGVLGLRRALRIAGVRTAIMSLWRVDDRAARRWMRTLYEARWKMGLDTPRSIHRASLSVLTERRNAGLGGHPAAWGAFIAVGDWR